MTKITCRLCQTKIDKKLALSEPNGNRNVYFCCEECHTKYLLNLQMKQALEEEKKRIAQNRSAIVELIQGIFMQEKMNNYAELSKMINELTDSYGAEKLIDFLRYNKTDLSVIMHKDFDSWRGKLGYFKAVVNNKLPVWHKPMDDFNVPEEHVQSKHKTIAKKKSIADIMKEVSENG